MKEWAKNYVGIPYLPKGRTMAGVDCLGLLYLIYAREYGIDLPDYNDYYHDDNRSIENVFNQNIWEWQAMDPAPGALVMFTIAGMTTHLGILVSEHKFIHSMQGCETAIDSLKSYRWDNRIEGVYKWAK